MTDEKLMGQVLTFVSSLPFPVGDRRGVAEALCGLKDVRRRMWDAKPWITLHSFAKAGERLELKDDQNARRTMELSEKRIKEIIFG